MPEGIDSQYGTIRRNVITGMNTKAHASMIGPTQVTSLINADLTQLGSTKKRSGFDAVADNVGTSPFTALAHFYPSGGSDWMVGVAGAAIYYRTSADNTWTSLHTISSTTYAKLIVGNSLCLMLNGTDNVHTINSALTVTDLGNDNDDPPLGLVGCWFKDRWFIAKDSTVYFSGVANQTFDRSANYFNVNAGDNDIIRAMIPFRNDELIIFKDHSVWQLYCPENDTPLTDWWLKPIDINVGCISYDAAVLVGNDIYFWSEDGLRSLTRNEQDKVVGLQTPVSDPIWTTYVENINMAYKTSIRLAYFQGLLICAVPHSTSTVADKWLVYHIQADPQYNGWSVWETGKSGAWTAAFLQFPVNGEVLLYFSHSDDGQIYQMFSGTDDDSEGIEYEEISRLEDLSEESLAGNQKYAKAMFIKCSAQDSSAITVEAQVDESGYQSVGSVDLDVDWPSLPQTLPFTFTGRSVTIEKFPLDNFGHWYSFQYKLTQAAASSYPLTIYDRIIYTAPDSFMMD